MVFLSSEQIVFGPYSTQRTSKKQYIHGVATAVIVVVVVVVVVVLVVIIAVDAVVVVLPSNPRGGSRGRVPLNSRQPITAKQSLSPCQCWRAELSWETLCLG